MERKLFFVIATVLCVAVAAQASVVTFVGNEVDGTAAEWRTSGTAKPYDLDGDNIYGTTAGVHWTVASTGEGPFWSYISAGGQYGGFPAIDSLGADDDGVTDAPGGIALSQFAFTINQDAATVRVGLMHDILAEVEWAADFGFSASLTELLDLDGDGIYGETGVDAEAGDEIGSSATSDILAAANGIQDMIFFDIDNVYAGSLFVLEGIYNDGRTQNAYMGPVSWDAVGVPEPATLVLLGMGGLACLRRKK